MKQEDLIINALSKAKELGVLVIKGPVFDWVHPDRVSRDIPYSCNAFGAVLLLLEKQDLLPNKEPYFLPGWREIVEEYLGVNKFWLWRFGRGFDGGSQIMLTVEGKDGKEKTVKDDISKLGIQLASKLVEKT